MAVIPSCPALSVNIRVRGQPVEEYEPQEGEREPDSEIPTTCSFIEAQTGENFAIYCSVVPDISFPQGSNALIFQVHIDGHQIPSVALLKSDLKKNTIVRIKDIRVQEQGGASMRYKFTFASISTTDDENDDTITQDRQFCQDMGTIRVVVEWGTCTQEIYESKRPSAIPITSDSIIAEKAMKGKPLSHMTRFSLTNSSPSQAREPQCLTRSSGTLAIFKFKYSSRDVLKSQIFMPQGLRSDPPGNSTNFNHDQSIKQEVAGPGLHAGVTYGQSLNVFKDDDGREIIDLTGD
ncbi:hypothetical protein CEP52_016226 [Fusarium oligoseptatum]|uniref:DUF7918 domain-containing protein n=1 Tax=Fusarium oligoseptatum TaxID=2604345 RepID=A0A428S638_9HYPO|nr:hypothetical protein CEP52_016226 [Fusarium oligoseptatum]